MSSGEMLKNRLRNLSSTREFGAVVAVIFICVLLVFLTPHFLKTTNLLNVARQISMLTIMAVGMGFVLICGEIDLSVGSIYGLSACLGGYIIQETGYGIGAIVAVLLAGILIGALNGILIAKVNIPAFVVTLGSMGIWRGVALLITGGWPVIIYNNESLSWFYFMGGGYLFGLIPMQFVFMLAVVIICGIVLHRTTLGYHTFAVGGNDRAATLYGINVAKMKVLAFTLTGFLSALAGLLALGFVQSAEPILGTGQELEVIAVCVIGGISVKGGKGSILGVILGGITMGVLLNGLILIGISPYLQKVIIGAVVIAAVYISERISSTSRQVVC